MTDTQSHSTFRSSTIAALCFLLWSAPSWGGSPFELDIKELDATKPPPAEPKRHETAPARPAHHAPARKHGAKGSTEGSEKRVRYTVRPGDHIFKILMREFNLSNDEAERLIPEVARINDITNIRRLSVGQVLLLPSKGESTRHVSRKPVPAPKLSVRHQPAPTSSESSTQAPAAIAQDETPPISPAESATAHVPQAPALPTETPTPSATQKASSAVPAHKATSVKLVRISTESREQMIDLLLKSLGIEPERNKIVEAGGGTGGALSIKVDRYFEDGGKRFIVNCSPKDSFNYTLLRLLERDGYQIIKAETEDFRTVTGNLLSLLHRLHSYEIRSTGKDDGGIEVGGYVVGDGNGDRQLFLTDHAKETDEAESPRSAVKP